MNPEHLGSADTFRLRDLVELRASSRPTRGRVVATRHEGTCIHVLWMERHGLDGKVTQERAADLRKVEGPP
ncbi:MAG TPA: hypothetical protein VEL75_09015 [Candidatus Methylomirabilis sp.]|nr:hypothetical protein [Candidatus Methylomirabilis sp.]